MTLNHLTGANAFGQISPGGKIASSARSHMANREEWTGLLPGGLEKGGKFECDSPFSPHKEKLFHAFEHTFQCSVFNLEVGS